MIKICMKKLQKENPARTLVRFANNTQNQLTGGAKNTITIKQPVVQPVVQPVIEPKIQLPTQPVAQPVAQQLDQPTIIEQNQVDLVEPAIKVQPDTVVINSCPHIAQSMPCMNYQPPQPQNDSILSNVGNIFIIVKNTSVDFMKENYGFVLIIILLCILLYIRYIEVQNKKNKKNNI